MADLVKVDGLTIQDAVRRFLERDLREHSFDQVVQTVAGDLHVSDAEVKAAIWCLHSLGQVELTAGWNLQSTAVPAGAAATG